MNNTTQNKTWFVSRHQSSINWMKSQSTPVDNYVTHIDDSTGIHPGDIVIGSLPVSIVAKLNQNKIRFISFTLDIPEDLRGIDLNEKQLDSLQVELKEYLVMGIEPKH